jgi:hypothetical protein
MMVVVLMNNVWKKSPIYTGFDTVVGEKNAQWYAVSFTPAYDAAEILRSRNFVFPMIVLKNDGNTLKKKAVNRSLQLESDELQNLLESSEDSVKDWMKMNALVNWIAMADLHMVANDSVELDYNFFIDQIVFPVLQKLKTMLPDSVSDKIKTYVAEVLGLKTLATSKQQLDRMYEIFELKAQYPRKYRSTDPIQLLASFRMAYTDRRYVAIAPLLPKSVRDVHLVIFGEMGRPSSNIGKSMPPILRDLRGLSDFMEAVEIARVWQWYWQYFGRFEWKPWQSP